MHIYSVDRMDFEALILLAIALGMALVLLLRSIPRRTAESSDEVPPVPLPTLHGNLNCVVSLGTRGDTSMALFSYLRQLPAEETQVVTTWQDNQSDLGLNLFIAPNEVSAYQPLGTWSIAVPPGPRGIPQVEIRFAIDAAGSLVITARDQRSGDSLAITRHR